SLSRERARLAAPDLALSNTPPPPGRVPPGAHEAAWVLDPERVLGDLRADPAVRVTSGVEEAVVEEGVL
ncbi:hypothetical protein, partial [Nonomuraea sp. NPDC059022]|uniref:hypothetical protein n=1 Tax=Nonomuraea sp. NPDC059022 TaxID=3346705 RepID=UPI0036C67395